MTERKTVEEIIEVQESTKLDEENVIYREIKDPYGFIYITTNLVNGKRYLGQKMFDEKWKKYLGSGVAFKSAVKKYGKENFHRDIIYICYSKEELNQIEYELSVFFDVVESDDWYNLVLGGGSTNCLRHSEATKKKLHDCNIGKTLPEDVKRKIGRTLSKIMSGRTFSEKHISESRIGVKNPGHRVVYCIELDEIFWGAKAAEIKYGIDNGSICKCCRGIRKTIGKHPDSGIPLHWKYAYDFTNSDETILGAITLGYITKKQVDDYLNSLKKKESNK